MGKISSILRATSARATGTDYESRQKAAEKAAAQAANASIADTNRRKRAQGGLLSSDESATVLSTQGKQGTNPTANATVLGSGGK